MTGPLDGIRVCDLTRVLAGPFATMKLADMGAEVIKVEEPKGGDDTRPWGPPFVGGESTYFLAVNRNKKSIGIDLKHARGKEVLARLVRTSDVVISNFRPGTMEKLGFGPDRVRVLNPRSVYCTISGYGDTREEWGRSSYDVIIQGESGAMHITGDPGGPPTKFGISIADEVAGMLAVEGILLSLFQRERTGKGERVDIALLDAMLALLTFQGQNYFATGKSPARRGNQHPSIVPYETYRTADGWINVGVGSEKLWAEFCRALERADLAADPRFATNADRVTNREALKAILDPVFTTRTTSEWIRLLSETGIPCGRIHDVGEALGMDSVARRGTVIHVDHPKAGRLPLVGNPIRLASHPGRRAEPPPLLGEHTGEVLAGLGYSPAEVAGLRESGAVR
ncbi:MAG: CoA transferase [Planctomycetes bacterium]|nr:CoA transferase [Planctomycetota bacterium]